MRAIFCFSLLLALSLTACSKVITPKDSHEDASPSLSAPLKLISGQSASVAIGAPDLLTAGSGNPSADSFDFFWGPGGALIDGKLFFSNAKRFSVFDEIPTQNGAAANRILGQADLSSNMVENPFVEVIAIATHGGKYYLADSGASLISVWSVLPEGEHTYEQADFLIQGLDENGLHDMTGMAIGGGKLVVSSYENQKISIWNTIPTVADAAPTFEISSAFRSPVVGLWTDGIRLLVAEESNRVLYWETFPTGANDGPEFVLGQETLQANVANGTAADQLNAPTYVTSNGIQIFVQDGNNRVLVWNSFPKANGVPADVVLGQKTFGLNTPNDSTGTGTDDGHPSANTLNNGGGWGGLFVTETKLFVGDQNNNRWLIFDSN